MSKFIKLTGPAYVNGRMRHPHEGVRHLDDGEAKRLTDDKSGEDVSADYTADDFKNVPIEGLRASSDDAEAALQLAPVEHQANITPTTETADAADAAKPAKKETAK